MHKQKESNTSSDENEMTSDFAVISHKTVFRKGREEKSFWVWQNVFLQDGEICPSDLATCNSENTKDIGVSLLMH